MAERYYRKIIRISGSDSPNVRLGLAQQAVGITPTNEILIPGVLSWSDYQKRLATWDSIRICIGISGLFYEGASVLLYPPSWLSRAERYYDTLKHSNTKRQARAIGIDPAEGGDKTAMCAIDEMGIIEMESRCTPDTSVITSEAIAFMKKHNVPPERVVFDRGGGGKEHADRLRIQGYPVRTVAFGESPSIELRRYRVQIEEKKDMQEERYAYVNRRAEMYGEFRLLLDPAGGIDGTGGDKGFAIPGEREGQIYEQLRQQMSPIPLVYDPEGRLKLPPKHRRDREDKQVTLTELIGHSPDELDSVVLGVHGMLHKVSRVRAGAIG